jgi:hypothetical protein
LHRSPTRWSSLFSFSFLSLTCGTRASASLFFLLLHFSPSALHCTAPHPEAPHERARAMGRLGRRLARTPSQGAPVCMPRGLPRGKRHLCPSSAMPKAVTPPTAALPRWSFRRANQPGRAPCPCPCPLDRTLQPPGPSPSRKPKPHWGFSPSLFAAARGRGGRSGGARAGRRRRRGRAERRRRCAGSVRGGHAGVPPRGKEKQSRDLDATNLFLAVACSLHQAGDDSTVDPR